MRRSGRERTQRHAVAAGSNLGAPIALRSHAVRSLVLAWLSRPGYGRSVRVRTPFALAAAVLALAPAAAEAAPKPRPNLVVVSVSNPGGPLTIETVTVANTGKRDAGASTARLFLSADRKRGGPDSKLPAVVALPSIKVAKRKAGSVLVAAPAGTKPGFYFVIACADSLRKVSESHADGAARVQGRMRPSVQRG
jgi:hypothetical protein